MRSSLLPALVAPLTASALDPRALAAPRLASYEFNGKGCPVPGATSISGSAASVALTLPDFVSELRGLDRTDFNVNCLATLSMDEGVSGYRLRIRKVWGEGMFYGSANTRLRVQSLAYFQGYERLSAVNTAEFNASGEASTLMSTPFDFGFEDSKQVFSQCVGDDLQVGNAYVNMRAIINWPTGSNSSYGAFLGTEENPVTEHIEFEWVACGDIDEPTPEELEEGRGGVVIGGEEGEPIVIGGEEGEPVLIGGDEGDAVLIGDDDEEGEDEVVLDEDGE